MRKVILAVGGLFLLLGLSAAVFFIAILRDRLYDQKEIANETFKMRISAYREALAIPPGVYFVFQSAPIKTEEWRKIMTVTGDEGIPVDPTHLRFVGPEIGYGFMSNFYAVTTDAGMNWTIWDGVKHIPVEYYEQHNLSPYIEDIELHPDGTGKMRMHKSFSKRDRGPDLVTKDYGVNWYIE